LSYSGASALQRSRKFATVLRLCLHARDVKSDRKVPGRCVINPMATERNMIPRLTRFVPREQTRTQTGERANAGRRSGPLGIKASGNAAAREGTAGVAIKPR
jgi:hypothetical protein